MIQCPPIRFGGLSGYAMYILARVSLLLLMLCSTAVSADVAVRDKIALVAPANHHAIVHRIEAALFASGAEHPNVIWVDPEKISEYHLDRECECNADLALIVAIGPKATRTMLQVPKIAPILSTLVYKSTFEDILCEFDLSLEKDREISAIYLDQPFTRSLHLANLLIPKDSKYRRVGMVLGPSSSLELQRYQVEAAILGVQLNAVVVNSDASPVTALNHVIDDSDVLLAIPDDHVFGTQTARGILLTAYRKQIPVAGYSHTYVKMGALSALYVTPKQVANQVVKSINDFLSHAPRKLPAPQVASNFSVTVNSHVAQLLKRGILSESIIKQQIEAHEANRDYIGDAST